MVGDQCDDGHGSPSTATENQKEVDVHSGKYVRSPSSKTNSCSSSVNSVKEDEVACINDIMDDKKAPSLDDSCKSRERAQDSSQARSHSVSHKSDAMDHTSNIPHSIDELEAVSDISHSESELSLKEEWMKNDTPRDPICCRGSTIQSVITNQSDHSSLQSIRENVDRILMSSGRSRSDSRECMQKNFSPAMAQMLYDQNYYKSADWLRFVPRRTSQESIPSRESNCATESDHGPSTPDHFYRMFDNTRIRVGMYSGQMKTTIRQQHKELMRGVNPGEDNIIAPTSETQIENFRLMHPDLVIDAPIDEEAAGMEAFADFEDTNETEVTGYYESNISPPTKEIYCDPNSDSCQIALEERCEIPCEDHFINEVVIADQTTQGDSNMQSFKSTLRKGAFLRPCNCQDYDQRNLYKLPEHPSEAQMHEASWDSKYTTYSCRIDQTQDDRAAEISLFSMARPHMRAFHFAWLTFFFVFLAWFSIAPLLFEIQVSLELTKEQIWTSSIFSVAGGFVSRCIMGVLCDMYGARLMSALVLFICGIPTMFTGLVNTEAGLCILRLVIGMGSSAFVTCQYWTSTMFTREVAGTANALAAGWGNLGGGVTLILTGSILFPFFEWIYSTAGAEDPSDLAWRSSCIIPGLICVVFTFVVIRSSDDSPKGNYQKRKHLGLMQKNSAMNQLQSGVLDYNTWILLIQYGCCFGVELTTSNAVALYFKEEFELSTASAAAVGSVFGFMNIFCRGLGGFLSDVSNAYQGMRGRLIWQQTSFFFEGVLIIIFSKAQTLGGAVASLVAFSLFVQAAEGSTFGIVPYLNSNLTGTVTGIIGAGGNAGAVVFSIIFRQTDYRAAFYCMGLSTLIVSALSNFIWIKGYQGLLLKKRVPSVQ